MGGEKSPPGGLLVLALVRVRVLGGQVGGELVELHLALALAALALGLRQVPALGQLAAQAGRLGGGDAHGGANIGGGAAHALVDLAVGHDSGLDGRVLDGGLAGAVLALGGAVVQLFQLGGGVGLGVLGHVASGDGGEELTVSHGISFFAP